jgi:hypothetical protein
MSFSNNFVCTANLLTASFDINNEAPLVRRMSSSQTGQRVQAFRDTVRSRDRRCVVEDERLFAESGNPTANFTRPKPGSHYDSRDATNQVISGDNLILWTKDNFADRIDLGRHLCVVIYNALLLGLRYSTFEENGIVK